MYGINATDGASRCGDGVRSIAAVLAVLAIFSLAAMSPADVASGDSRSSIEPSPMPRKFVGTWHLVRERTIDRDGNRAGSLFDDAVGRLTYTPNGDVWALVAELRDVTGAGVWYTGTAEVKRHTPVVVHHVEYSTVPPWIGTDLVRGYRFMDGGARLRLTAALSSELTDVLTWSRSAGG
jgi:hypothetical protein